jgi:hypothetical protein
MVLGDKNDGRKANNMTNILKAELIATLAKIQTVGSKEHHALGLVKLAIQGANSIDAIEGVITGASALIGYVDWLAKCAAILSWLPSSRPPSHSEPANIE